jgi:hypothetical protein
VAAELANDVAVERFPSSTLTMTKAAILAIPAVLRGFRLVSTFCRGSGFTRSRTTTAWSPCCASSRT